ncbi:hypothetical protein [Halodesulfovibrio marinisediminis]|uniref:Uncharacterized protein n=1 Tax=Halodesulfovibrio marinisediminis DSM 17456 TaxID=1121457 RepID=A0A1N6FQX5_9BACT|nr:hypothetical protein [Halodesulfovibrio marinisediminis]SIN97601.1 hypothetical protein SAMN02745161_1453 [Halodesulfovibrio marinisediminis DSM 17456]
MARELSSKFIEDLKEGGTLYPFLEFVRKDTSLDMQIRPDEVHIYYRGIALLIVRLRVGKYDMLFNQNYLTKSYEVDLPSVDNTLMDDPERWVEVFADLKTCIDVYLSCNEKTVYYCEEQVVVKDFLQTTMRENNYSAVAPRTDYHITDIDCQSSFSTGTIMRFDMLGLYLPTKAAAQIDPNPALAVFAMRFGSMNLTGPHGLMSFLEKLFKLVEGSHALEELATEVEKVFYQRKRLLLPGSMVGPKEGFTEIIRNKPHLVINLANLEPEGGQLGKLIRSNELQNVVRLLRDSMDVKFAHSRFMGYGIYRKCLYSLDEIAKFL